MIIENLPVPFDRRVWQEANTLRSAGYQVSIVCPAMEGYRRRFEIINNIHIYRFPLPVEADTPLGYISEYSWALLAQFYLTCKVAVNRGFDVIHACNPPDNIFLVALPFKLFGKRFIFDHHDLMPELFEAKFQRRGRIYQLLLIFERWTYRFADVVIATNESYKAIAETRGGKNSSDVYVVRSGPDLDRISLKAANAGLRNGRNFLVGYVGVMGRQEGISYLLEAAHHIVHDIGRSDVHFTLVGGGTELATLKDYSEKLGLADFVTFTGRVPDAQLLDVLSTADVCINSDVCNEMNDKSTMNKIMEYMALAKPIVQFECTEGRFSAQTASLYAEPNNGKDMARKIVTLLDDEAMRSRMGKFGKRRVEDELAWQHQEPKLLEAYERAFAKRANGRGNG